MKHFVAMMLRVKQVLSIRPDSDFLAKLMTKLYIFYIWMFSLRVELSAHNRFGTGSIPVASTNIAGVE